MSAPYLQLLQSKFPKKSEPEIELMLAGSAKWQGILGTDATMHRRASMRRLFPHRIEHAWRQRMIWSWEDARSEAKREISWIGSAMSNKTGTLADLLLQLLWENPDNTTILIAGPSEQATKAKLWAEIVKSFHIATSKHPFLRGKLERSKGRISTSEVNIRAGIEMFPVDDHGKIIGSNNDDVVGGNLILAVDELPALKNNGVELLDAVGNLKMRPSFTLLATGNFAELFDGLGMVCEPDLPGGYDALDIDESDVWDTVRDGRVYRFDGMKSPNVLARRDDFPFLTRWAEVKRYIDRGLTDTADFYRWIRSFPVLGLDSKTILTMAAIRSGNALSEPEWTSDAITRLGACDPGFGGDAAILQELRIGQSMVLGRRVPVLYAAGGPVTIPIRVKKGDSIETVNRQLVEYSRTWAEQRGIAPRNFAFDGSMRAGIVQEFMRRWSVECVALDFGGPATDRRMSANTEKRWKDEAANFVTEMWMAMQLLVDAGQARGFQNIDAAVRQFCNRHWKWAGKKKQIETKDEYKKRNANHSPNEADTMVVGLELARRRGFHLMGTAPSEGGAKRLLHEMARAAQLSTLRRMIDGPERTPGRLNNNEEQNLVRPHLHN